MTRATQQSAKTVNPELSGTLPENRKSIRGLARVLFVFALLVGFVGLSPQASAEPFETPSRNIFCYTDRYDWANNAELPVSKRPLICLIFEANWSLPPDYGDGDTSCDLDRTRSLTLEQTGAPVASWVCHGDVFWPAPAPQQPYGSEWREAGYRCAIERTGVTCRNKKVGGSLSVVRGLI